ncbi:MAG: DUF3737 family protein [Clostridia bacterium]|nr:DUF3737 family protein [Clostridia bacterium]
MKEIKDQIFDEERALYCSNGLMVSECTFAGAADGESALKESRNITVEKSRFELRYPFWHDDDLTVRDCTLTSTCRAPVWYTKNALFENCDMESVKAFRECDNVTIKNCRVVSPELLWNCHNVHIEGGEMTSEYFMMGSSDIEIDKLTFGGKYSFQYVKNAVIRNSVLNTKDAFWHTENVSVYDSVISGEYAAWYSKNLRLYRCKIIGTQPFCYAEDLYMEDCTMEKCDLSFENTTVNATINSVIDSVKNPFHGRIAAKGYGEIILDEHLREGADCEIVTF